MQLYVIKLPITVYSWAIRFRLESTFRPVCSWTHTWSCGSNRVSTDFLGEEDPAPGFIGCVLVVASSKLRVPKPIPDVACVASGLGFPGYGPR